MGITVFDLFNEIITGEDMKRFLQQHGVKEDYFGAGLILRTFLQMLEIAPIRKSRSTAVCVINPSTTVITEIVDECPVKIEETDSYDEIDYSDQEIGSRLSEMVSSDDDDMFIQYEKDQRQLPDLMRTCKTKKCGCGEGKLSPGLPYGSNRAGRQHWFCQRARNEIRNGTRFGSRIRPLLRAGTGPIPLLF